MAPVLPVVILHWNRPERCVGTVARFLDQDVPGGVRVVVVDNGSELEAVAAVRKGLPAGVEMLELPRNRGFGPGANAGFRHVLAHPDPADVGWIGLAPHDAEPAPGCLARMLEVAGERPRAGLACADFGDGATPVVDPYFGGILAPATVADGWEPAGHPHGTLMLARRQVLEEVGLFDERYFAYCEEADLALRAAAAGWETGLIRGAIVVNPDLGTRVSVIDYLQLRNTLLLVREHSGRYHATIRGLLAVGQLLAGLAIPDRRGPYWDPLSRVRALADHARGRYGAPPLSVQDRVGHPDGVPASLGVVDEAQEAAIANAHAWFEHHSGWAPPDEDTLEEWAADGVCRAPDDCLVTPGGVCEHGLASWQLILDALAE